MTPRAQIRLLVADVAHRHGLQPRDIYEPGRFKHIVAARKECVRTASETYGLSSTQLGRHFGRHHTSILYTLGRTKQG